MQRSVFGVLFPRLSSARHCGEAGCGEEGEGAPRPLAGVLSGGGLRRLLPSGPCPLSPHPPNLTSSPRCVPELAGNRRPGRTSARSSLPPRRPCASPDLRQRRGNTHPSDDQRLVEVYAPREPEAPGRRAREHHGLGHPAFLGWGAARGGLRSPRVPTPLPGSAPAGARGSFIPAEGDVRARAPALPEASSNFGSLSWSPAAGVCCAPAGCSHPGARAARAEEAASGYSFQHPLQGAPVLLLILGLELSGALYCTFEAFPSKPKRSIWVLWVS